VVTHADADLGIRAVSAPVEKRTIFEALAG